MRLSIYFTQAVGIAIRLITILVLGIATQPVPAFAEEEPPLTPVQVTHTRLQTIVGGKPADPDEWGWQVLVRPGGRLCGGALIAKEWVVTAAHCVYQTDGEYFAPEQIHVVVGEYNRSITETGEQTRAVTELFAHDNFDKWSNNNDIVLLHLATPVTITEHVNPVALLTEEAIALTEAGHLATVTGWGTTSEGGAVSQILMEVTVPIVDNTICNRSYGIITDNMLCAGYAEGGKDACQGDSGGPLVVQDEDGQWYLAGIVSFGYGCARANFYGVYTRISQYSTWIKSIIDVHTRETGDSGTDDADIDTGDTDTSDTDTSDTDTSDTDTSDTDIGDTNPDTDTGTGDGGIVAPDIADDPTEIETPTAEANHLYLPLIVR